jgi:hypothetical protein
MYPQVGIILSSLIYFRLWPPVPTAAIGVLGVVAVFMAVRAEHLSIGESIVYIFIAFALFMVEMRTVYRDQDQRDRERGEQQIRESEARKDEEKSFGDLLQKENGLLTSIKDVGTLAQRSLENITGGHSFAVVTPQVWSGLVPIPLSIRNYGKQTLTGVTVTIRGRQAWDFMRNPKNPYSFYRAEASSVNVGTLHQGEMKIIAETISPTTEGLEKEDEFQLDIAAQNFTVTEHLLFKKGTKIPWDFRYIVLRQYVKSQTEKETKFGYEKMAETDWTEN